MRLPVVIVANAITKIRDVPNSPRPYVRRESRNPREDRLEAAAMTTNRLKKLNRSSHPGVNLRLK
jgi:hypothetical protein